MPAEISHEEILSELRLSLRACAAGKGIFWLIAEIASAEEHCLAMTYKFYGKYCFNNASASASPRSRASTR